MRGAAELDSRLMARYYGHRGTLQIGNNPPVPMRDITVGTSWSIDTAAQEAPNGVYWGYWEPEPLRVSGRINFTKEQAEQAARMYAVYAGVGPDYVEALKDFAVRLNWFRPKCCKVSWRRLNRRQRRLAADRWFRANPLIISRGQIEFDND